MTTTRQNLGQFGEDLVVKECACPRCKKGRTLRKLPTNFKCADLICDFCGFLAQVKTSKSSDGETMPKMVLGAAWAPQKERMNSAIYFPLYLVIATADYKKYAIYYLSADLQIPEIFIERKPLSSTAKRAGWQGFHYDISKIRDRFIRLY